MQFLSVFLRISALLAAALTLFIYWKSDNQIHRLSAMNEHLKTGLDAARADNQIRMKNLEDRQKQLDQTRMELTEAKKNLRRADGSLQLKERQIDDLRSRLDEKDEALVSIQAEQIQLRKEIIDLQTENLDPANDTRLLKAKIQEQESYIQSLESDLNDSRLVLKTLLETSLPTGDAPHVIRICQWDPKKNLLVMELPARHRIQGQTRLELRIAGEKIGHVLVLKVSSGLCIGKFLSKIEQTESLSPGTAIQYKLLK